MPKLVINAGTPEAREFELKPGANYIGRGFANDLQIEDPSVSSSHVQVDVNGGSVTVTDLGSTNGTFINNAPSTNQPLQSGQILRLGGVRLVFEADTVAAASAPAEMVSAPPQVGGLRLAKSAPALVAGPPPIPPAQAAPSPSPPPLPLPSLPPLAPPITAPAPVTASQAAKKSVCRFHPKSPARWLCPQCGQMYCDLCVGTRKVAEGTGYFCRPCGAQCSSVGLEVHVNAAMPGSFFSLLPGAFSYPFKHGGTLILVCGTLFLGLVDFLRGASRVGGPFLLVRGLLLHIIFLGYLFAYMQNIIQTTARGDENEPDLPDITNFVEDLLIPCLQFLATVLLSFGPVFAVLIWSYNSDEGAASLAVVPAIVLGCLYFPMGFLAVAMFDTITALNPMLVVPSITKAPLQYLTACALLGLVFLVRWIGNGVLKGIFPDHSLLVIIPDIISSFIGLYFLTVQCRILGLLYFANKPQFGWFKR